MLGLGDEAALGLPSEEKEVSMLVAEELKVAEGSLRGKKIFDFHNKAHITKESLDTM